ncbi:hypothetical protein D3C85_1886100 [compost metagenome]
MNVSFRSANRIGAKGMPYGMPSDLSAIICSIITISPIITPTNPNRDARIIRIKRISRTAATMS